MIKVPSDGVSDGSINGLEVGDTVVINGEERTIVAVGFSDPASGTATFTLDRPLTTAPLAGVPVQERKIIDVIAYSGTVQTVGDDVVVPVVLTVTSGAGTTGSVTQIATYTTGLAVLTKYVRNVTRASGNSAGSGGQSFTLNGATPTFYTGGVTGQSGDVLEYVLLIQNTGTGAVPNMRVDDKIPVQFVAVKTGAYGGRDVLHLGEDGTTETTMTFSADGDAAAIIPPGDLLVVYVGSGAAAGSGGTIQGGKSVLVAYRVTIK